MRVTVVNHASVGAPTGSDESQPPKGPQVYLLKVSPKEVDALMSRLQARVDALPALDPAADAEETNDKSDADAKPPADAQQ